jgi:hypothetical protein
MLASNKMAALSLPPMQQQECASAAVSTERGTTAVEIIVKMVTHKMLGIKMIAARMIAFACSIIIIARGGGESWRTCATWWKSVASPHPHSLIGA